MLLKIARMGHPVLRMKAEPVTPEDVLSDDIQDLIEDMIETMEDSGGVGIAAPQVHVSLRLIIARINPPGRKPSPDGEPEPVAIVNPVITWTSGEEELGSEGCLSIPDIRGFVPRNEEIEVEGLDASGKALKFRSNGFDARIIQHEIDHLDGILFLDRMTDLATLGFTEEFEKFLVDPEDEESE